MPHASMSISPSNTRTASPVIITAAPAPGPNSAQAAPLPPALAPVPAQRSQAAGFLAVFAGLALLIIAMWAVQNCKDESAPPADEAAKSSP